jgi:arsenite methyltransferase
VGVDLSAANLARAAAEAERRGLAGLATFRPGDAERLPVEDRAFDAVVCECAFCLFPDKPAAAGEFARALRPGGRLGLADVALDPTRLPVALQGLVARVACLADARPVAAYRALLEAAGLRVEHGEDHGGALLALVDTLRTRLLAAQVAVRLGQLEVGGVDLAQGRALVQQARAAVAAGQATYVLLAARRAAA